MTWQTTSIPIIRSLIGDLDSSAYTYTDTRLTQIALSSAHLLLNEVSFDTTYAVDVVASSITPDPTSLSPVDSTFVNLLALRSSVLILGSEARTKAISSIAFKDGPSSIETGGAAKATMELANMVRGQYEKAKLDYIAGNSVGAQAVTSPILYQSISPNLFQ